MARTAAASLAIARGSLPAIATAAPPIVGGLVIVAVLMGPSGMAPADVASAAADLVVARALLWIAWLAALAAAASRLLHEPSLLYLRWLPIPRWHHAMATVGLLALIEAPWALFWVAAAGPSAGLAVLVGAMSAHLAMVARARSRAERALFLGVGVAALAPVVGGPSPLPAGIAVGIAALAFLVPMAWRRAGEAPPRPFAPVARGGPVRALWSVLAADQVQASTLGQLLVVATVFGGLAGAFVRANDIGGGDAILVIAMAATIGSVGVASGAANQLATRWRALRWLLRVSLASPARQAAAIAASAATLGAVAGLGAAAVAVVIARPDAPVAALAIATSAGAVATLAITAVTAATRASPTQPTHAWTVAIGVALGIAATVLFAGLLGLIIAPALVLWAVVNLSDTAAAPAPLPERDEGGV